MPYINLQVTRGITRDQKEQIVQQFTGTLVNVLGKKPEHIHIVIQEIDAENWGFSGMLTDDYRKKTDSSG
ncbi:tautomerase family protein [Niabella drilacis]|uniref:Tautomerase n=1 Tax=Niabella drilacis (strain DSM 25811 / CCM 8410 / CCUG 62505 / LMG 26954 / E90) TaxID=1285928 RepID=A0A1G6S0J6_NIADE|nr:4-oxalocrotonate tautomerase family protein [Niabella drilacis]SDD09725.1 4-oxalocrotonate tautomerase [Niabella drilacis]